MKNANDSNHLFSVKTQRLKQSQICVFAVAVQPSGSVVKQAVVQNKITVVITIVAAPIASTNSMVIFTIFRFYGKGLSQNCNEKESEIFLQKKIRKNSNLTFPNATNWEMPIIFISPSVRMNIYDFC